MKVRTSHVPSEWAHLITPNKWYEVLTTSDDDLIKYAIHTRALAGIASDSDSEIVIRLSGCWFLNRKAWEVEA